MTCKACVLLTLSALGLMSSMLDDMALKGKESLEIERRREKPYVNTTPEALFPGSGMRRVTEPYVSPCQSISLSMPAAVAESSTAHANRAPRGWVSRACDRCRKRKARCDESNPCRNCEEAGAKCTHDKPVLKRGPRPRQHHQDLEVRLRSLEHLIASIPGSGPNTATLTTLELEEIQRAAQIPSSSPMRPAPDPWAPSQGDGWIKTETNGQDGHVWAQPSIEFPNPTPQSSMAPQYATPGSAARPSMSLATMGEIRSPTGGHDLLYKDSEGQTRYLGPSSGMPLLDKLKSDTSPGEEWMSLSAAIGVEVDRQPLPTASTYSPANGSHGANGLDLWPRLLAILPQDAVEHLVRSYFTISHLLWPILHAPTFMAQLGDSTLRRSPTFFALVLSVCSLSSRYSQAPAIAHLKAKQELIALAKEVITSVCAEASDLFLVQALFNMSVVQEGTARPNLLWMYLSQAISMAIELGLHRRVDEWSSFTAVDVEVRKRIMWAIYSQDVKASCTYGRPPMLRLRDLDLDEPAPVDDVFISVNAGVGIQPDDRPSLMAGFVAAVRLHMVLERAIRRINRIHREGEASFAQLAAPASRAHSSAEEELHLLQVATEGLPGDWTYTAETVLDQDSVRFFQKTRVFTLRCFIRLLIARHQFSEWLESSADSSSPDGGMSTVRPILHQIAQGG